MQRMMPLIVLICLVTTGCMDLVIRMEVKKDGSAKSTIRMEMLDQSYQQMAVMAQTAGTDISILEKDKMVAYLSQYQGTLDQYQNVVEDGVRKIHIVASVPQGRQWINGLADDSMLIKREGDHWAWTFLDSEMGRSMASMDQNLIEQQLVTLAPTFAGLNWKIDMVVPEILDTNMEKVDGKTARFTLNFDRDIAEKSGAEAADAFRNFLTPKWVKFKGMK